MPPVNKGEEQKNGKRRNKTGILLSLIHILCETKKSHPHIKNYLLLAYHPAIRAVKKPEGFDDTILLDGQETVPPRVAVTRLNRKMIREADYLIAYVRYITNGSYKLLEVAKASAVKGQIVITNLAELLGGPLQ